MRLPRSSTSLEPHTLILSKDGIPLLYEDEEEEMGEANLHAWAVSTLYFCLPACMKNRHPALQVFQNLNCFYLPSGPPSPKTGCKPNFASDIMIVHANEPMPFHTVSYTIGVDGPVPELVLEALSEETQTRDTKDKMVLYSKLGIAEYIFVDLTGRLLPKKLELRRLQASGKWKIVKDASDGVTSKLGFRLHIDDTDSYGLRIADAATGKQMVRPHEASGLIHQPKEAALAEVEKRIQALQAEVDRLRGNLKI